MVSSDVVFLGSMLSQARHFLCSTQDIPCVPSRTRLKNREDGSDFDDFLTKSIASPRTFFLKIFAPPKIFSRRRFRRCRRRRRRSVNHTSYLQHCIYGCGDLVRVNLRSDQGVKQFQTVTSQGLSEYQRHREYQSG